MIWGRKNIYAGTKKYRGNKCEITVVDNSLVINCSFKLQTYLHMQFCVKSSNSYSSLMKNSLVWLKNRMCSLRCHLKIKYFQASFCIGRSVRLQWLLKQNHQISRFCSHKTWRLINKLLKIHQHLTKYCQTGALSLTGDYYPDYHFWRNGSGSPKISTKWIKFSPRLGDCVA